MDFAPNHLYYGDCLDVMDSWPDESVDLVYLDPPLNLNARNFVFPVQNTEKSDTVHEALTGVWTWNAEARQRLKRLQNRNHPAERAMRAAEMNLGCSDVLVYLTYIAERLTVMKRILKSTGAIYLHCNSTVSHYLRPVMDALFGPENYRNEIIWSPTGGRAISNSPNSKKFSVSSDTILFYGMPNHQFKVCYEPDPDVERRYSHVNEKDKRFALMPLWRSPNMNARPNLNYEWRGYVNPHPSGWLVTKERLEQLHQNGRIYFRNNRPYRIHYMDEDKGKRVGNVWTDVRRLQSIDREFLGYPTQKPLALLERILKASSNEGDLILDPFCGCGTTIEAGLKLDRKVIGIDVSMFALDAINEVRLKERYPRLSIKIFDSRFKLAEQSETQQALQFPPDFKPTAPGGDSTVIYQLKDAFGTNFKVFSELVKKERYQFQNWAVQQIGIEPNAKESGDGGIDGASRLVDDPQDYYESFALAQVKSGNWKLDHVRAFCYTLNDNNAACGVFITLDSIGLKSSAHEIAAEFGNITVGSSTYPRLQLWSIKEFYEKGALPNLPPLRNRFED